MKYTVCLAGLGLALSIGQAQAASITQITANVGVEQDVITLQGHPGFFDDLSGAGYVFFEEHRRILLAEANVWDQSQIPTSAAGLTCSSGGTKTGPSCASVPYNVISQGTLTGTWTFDADLLAGIDTSTTQSIGADGEIVGPQFLGQTSDVSRFTVVSGGRLVENAITSTTLVFAANNVDLGDGGGNDIIGIVARPDPEPNIDSSGAILYLAGSGSWFEDAQAAGTLPDLGGILFAQMTYDEISSAVYPSGLEEQFEVVIDSGIVPSSSLNVASFGDADGSSEDSPLLPDAAGFAEGATAPTFSFDVAGAGEEVVFVDPEIAVGYVYDLIGEGTIAQFVAPTQAKVNDSDGYVVTLPDGTAFTVLPGGTIDFVAAGKTGVTTFELTGIDQSLMLDPADTTTFVAGFLFSGTGQGSTLTQTALVIDTDAPPPVPLPASLALLLAGVGGLGLVGRKRRAAA